ncbi:hypothetical protein ACP4OV_006000 [Aristida adscensionis]
MSDRSSPPFFVIGQQPQAWDVTFKVKYGDTLKRFCGSVNGSTLNINLSALRSKIASAFKFGPSADFILTYTDEDGDVVMLDDDDDLRDAALHQKLNPLRINVQLKSNGPTEKQESNSTPVMKPTAQDPLSQIMSAFEALKPVSNSLSSTATEERLAQIRSAVGDAMKSIPEPIPDALAKLSHEVLHAAPPPLAELIKPFVQLIPQSNSSKVPSEVRPHGSSSSSSGVTETQMPVKANNETKARAFGSQPPGSQKSESAEARGLKSVLDEDAAATPRIDGASQGQQSSLYPSVEQLLFSPNDSVVKSVCKGKNGAQSKGKSVMSSAAQPAAPTVPSLAPPPPPPSISEWFPRRCQSHRWQSEANSKATTDSKWRVPMYKVPYSPPAPLSYAPPGYGPAPHFPYPGRLLSSEHVYGDLGHNTENSAPRSLHRWIQCDGCGVQPIVGSRYKSKVKEDYDLCDSCFQRMGNEVEYTKIDKPISPHRLSRDPNVYRKAHPRVLMKSKREKLESRFILDVTVLDGTLMAPSTPFTKIWRMHNNGSIMWPLGTQLIWVGGDQFALQTSVPLEIPVNGFPVDKEIDVAVDFVAPARPGRYISYWKLASPSGQKFGQRVWVHIQVEDPSFVNDNNRNASINLNLPPESSSTNSVNLIDVIDEPIHTDPSAQPKRPKEFHFHPVEASEPRKSQPAPFVVPSVPAEAPANPIVDVPFSAASFVPYVNVPAPEPVVPEPQPAVYSPITVPIMTTPVPVNVPEPAPASSPAPAPASAPALASAFVPLPSDASAPEPLGIDGDTEEKLLRELEEMGFRQIDLNKEILRQNKYNLEQSVDDLCGVNEWDPLLADLEEMGFDDTEMNKELLAKNGGSIKRAVMDLIAREKKDK